MMSIPKYTGRFFARKKALLVAGISLATLVVLSAGGWWLLSQHSDGVYRSKVNSYVASASDALSNASGRMQEAVKANETTATIDALNHLSDTLVTQAAEAPAAPMLLGVTLAQTDREALATFRAKVEQCVQTVRDTVALLMYEQKVADLLNKLNGQAGTDAAAQKTLAQSWQAAAAELETLEPSQAVKEAHTQLIETAKAMHVRLATLPELFTQQDYQGFLAAQDQLEAPVNQLHAQAKAFQDAAATLDKNLTEHYQAVHTALLKLTS